MTVFVDPDFSVDALRQSLYKGNLVVLTHLRTVSDFVKYTRDQLTELFSPHDPEHAHKHHEPGYSVDFRTVDVRDLLADTGAPLVDAHCTGTAIRDFHNVADGSAFDEHAVRSYSAHRRSTQCWYSVPRRPNVPRTLPNLSEFAI